MSAKRTDPKKRVTFAGPSSPPRTSAPSPPTTQRRRSGSGTQPPVLNRQETSSRNSSRQSPQWKPTPPEPEPKGKGNATEAMAEPRARAARHKGQMNFENEVRSMLQAYGDPSPHPDFPNEPLPETVRVLDEIITDFILESCHGAEQVAHHAGRQKVKVEDFHFALRHDPNKLGRVQELHRMERELKEARKAFDQNDDQVAKDAEKKGAAAAAAAAAAGEDSEAEEEAAAASVASKKGNNKGKGKSVANRRGSDATEESVAKKRKTIG